MWNFYKIPQFWWLNIVKYAAMLQYLCYHLMFRSFPRPSKMAFRLLRLGNLIIAGVPGPGPHVSPSMAWVVRGQWNVRIYQDLPGAKRREWMGGWGNGMIIKVPDNKLCWLYQVIFPNHIVDRMIIHYRNPYSKQSVQYEMMEGFEHCSYDHLTHIITWNMLESWTCVTSSAEIAEIAHVFHMEAHCPLHLWMLFLLFFMAVFQLANCGPLAGGSYNML